ncbi:contractile injection system protein, VgrG/Pvc8 family [Methylotuvimicrobium sp.]|uniref:contractile injection system protein, VgrG/Pvc8 family n=1 Tax=Methylotuvimicrobium sp. TaxID=2822413 RepID=UPI003D658DD7
MKAGTPLGDDQLIFYRLTGKEEIGRLFEFDVEMIRDQKLGGVKADQLLGKGMTVNLDLPNGTTRHINGEIVQFKHTGLRRALYLLSGYVEALAMVFDVECRLPDISG